ncbi:MAG: hypothetical protein KAW87_03155 [Candidatus Cloacimonetes bacterium]|nr:hypothetical protein [Candidatus Cloacimonadota bacterium]
MLKEILRLFKKSDLFMEAHQEACQMLKSDNQMFDNVCAKLRGRPIPHPDVNIFDEEKKVDKTERAIRKKVLTHISLSNIADTPGSIILIGIVIDLERIGDYTTNIAELSQVISQKLEVGELEDELQDIENNIAKIFDVVTYAFESYDKKSAQSVASKTLPRHCDALLKRLMTEDLELSPQNAVISALYIRYLKRVASHLINVATTLVQPFDKVRFLPQNSSNK